jgi:transposase
MDVLNPRKPKEPKKIGREPKYNLDYYMMMAKQVVEQGMSYREAAKIYNMSHGSVHHWKKVYLDGKFPKMKKSQGTSVQNKLLQHETHIRNLKQEIADLYLENKMLKKMFEYSQHLKKENLSTITSENLDQYQEDVK